MAPSQHCGPVDKNTKRVSQTGWVFFAERKELLLLDTGTRDDNECNCCTCIYTPRVVSAKLYTSGRAPEELNPKLREKVYKQSSGGFQSLEVVAETRRN